jgi:hypothetical protein
MTKEEWIKKNQLDTPSCYDCDFSKCLYEKGVFSGHIRCLAMSLSDVEGNCMLAPSQIMYCKKYKERRD